MKFAHRLFGLVCLAPIFANAQTISVPVGSAGTASTFTATGSSSGSSSTGLFSAGTLSYSETGNLETLQANSNGIVQLQIQNTNAGSTASADVVVANDQATATTHYGNFGINSSGFTGSGSLSAAGSTYLYAANGDLAIGTLNANAIHIVVGNGATDAGTVSSGGVLSLASSPIFTGQTGYAYANGSSALTYSTTIPAASVSGLSGTYAPLASPSFTGTPVLGAATFTTLNGWAWNSATVTLAGTTGQTYTFPSTTATLAPTGSPTFTGTTTFGSGAAVSFGVSRKAIIDTAPTYSSGFSTGTPTITGLSTLAFTVTIGTTPSSSGVLTMPAGATTGWACKVNDITTTSEVADLSATTTTSITTTFYSRTNGTATSPTASDVIQYMCAAY